jgi:4-hydroxybenzoate polyprenyltransferase
MFLEFVRLARPRQWIKNAFVAAPLFFSPAALNGTNVVRVALAIAVFCLLSSAVYAINDTCDRDADRLHPEKRLRPVASGAIAPVAALVFACVLASIGLALALQFLDSDFLLYVALYLILNIAYSTRLKHVAIIDVLVVAFGFVLRVDAGAAVIGVQPSVWIVTATGLLALFLALAKRRDDLVKTMSGDHRRSLDGYNLRFVDTTLSVTLGAMLVCYLMYTTDPEVTRRFGTERLWITTPFVVAGIMRYLQITFVEERSGAPTEIVLTDRFMVIVLAGWAMCFALLIYR